MFRWHRQLTETVYLSLYGSSCFFFLWDHTVRSKRGIVVSSFYCEWIWLHACLSRVRTVVLYTVLWTVLAKYRKRPFSTPHRSKTPQPIDTKICTFDYVIKVTWQAKFHHNRFRGRAPQIRGLRSGLWVFFLFPRSSLQLAPSRVLAHIIYQSTRLVSRMCLLGVSSTGDHPWGSNLQNRPPYGHLQLEILCRLQQTVIRIHTHEVCYKFSNPTNFLRQSLKGIKSQSYGAKIFEFASSVRKI